MNPAKRRRADPQVARKFIKWYQTLPNDSSDHKVLRLFSKTSSYSRNGQSGDVYYTVYGDMAKELAIEYFHTQQHISYYGAPANKDTGTNALRLPCIHIRSTNLQRILRDYVIRMGHHVEIYQYISPEGWTIVKKASPGNTQAVADLMGGVSDLNRATIIAIVLQSRQNVNTLGVAICNANSHSIELCEFIDTPQFSNLESLLVTKGVRECILCDDKTTKMYMETISTVLTKGNVSIVDMKKNEFNEDLTSQIQMLVEHDLVQMRNILEQSKLGAMALVGLVKHMELVQDTTNHGRFRIENFRIDNFMKLDTAALTALNLFPAVTDTNKNMCLFGLLDKCRTAMGRRILNSWIRQPLVDVECIKRRQNFVEAFVMDRNLRERLHDDLLRKVPDLEDILKKLQRGKATLRHIFQLYMFQNQLPAILEALRNHESKYSEVFQTDFISQIENMKSDLVNFGSMVEHVIDLDRVREREYVIAPSFDKKLKKYHREQEQLKEEMHQLRRQVARELDLKKPEALKLEFKNQYGYHFRVPKAQQKALRGHSQFTQLSTQKSGILFTFSDLKETSRAWCQTKEAYEERQKQIVEKVFEITKTYSSVMEKGIEIFSQLDVFVSLGHVAQNAPNTFCRPTMLPMGTGIINMKNARHPCMEMQDHHDFIANDVRLETGLSHFQIVTGPNMGGKSTYIRQIGVIVLMAQIGSFVPCDQAEISVCDCILARVGAGDNQLKGVSTFMAEMLEASTILNAATSNSLVIIDELGRGTSTYDGFGLAYAISEHICQEIGSFCLFATHFHELTKLEGSVPGVINKHVSAYRDVTANTLTMKYEVQDGACDKSFGIEVAEIARFPEPVIIIAKQKAAELEAFEAEDKLDLATQSSIRELIAAVNAIDAEVLTKQEIQDKRREIQEQIEEMCQKNNVFNALTQKISDKLRGDEDVDMEDEVDEVDEDDEADKQPQPMEIDE